jgi:hypothetical protein
MECLQCGFCCVRPTVRIVHPYHVDSLLLTALIVNDQDIEENVIHIRNNIYHMEEIIKPKNEPPLIINKLHNMRCPHQVIKDGKSSCKVHHKFWFEGTVCDRFNTLNLPPWMPKGVDTKCPIGKKVLKDFDKDWMYNFPLFQP